MRIDFNPRFPRGKRLRCWSDTPHSDAISIHASRGGSDVLPVFRYRQLQISIHASRGGSDLWRTEGMPSTLRFQSTLPAGEATITHQKMTPYFRISIHASRGGSDPVRFSYMLAPGISIHASRGGSDTPWAWFSPVCWHFNPRFPRGKRPLQHVDQGEVAAFQSTLPAGEATGT